MSDKVEAWVGVIALIVTFGMVPMIGKLDADLKDKCLRTPNQEYEYNLVALKSGEGEQTKGSSNIGGVFLMGFGGLSGSGNISTDEYYYLRYAYEDNYGIKINTDKINNDSKVRIQEIIDDTLPRMKTTHSYYFDGVCKSYETMRVFQIPAGSFLKTFDVKL